MKTGNYRLNSEWCALGGFEVKSPHAIPDMCKALGISQRETETLYRIAKGQNVGQIAHDLGVSSTTVRTYKRRICEKLGVDHMNQAIALATAAICGVELRPLQPHRAEATPSFDLPIEAMPDKSGG